MTQQGRLFLLLLKFLQFDLWAQYNHKITLAGGISGANIICQYTSCSASGHRKTEKYGIKPSKVRWVLRFNIENCPTRHCILQSKYTYITFSSI